jgi:hypothetical protein
MHEALNINKKVIYDTDLLNTNKNGTVIKPQKSRTKQGSSFSPKNFSPIP